MNTTTKILMPTGAALPKCQVTEKYVLGLIMVCQDRQVLGELEPEHFVVGAHQLVFRELRLLVESGAPLEPAAYGRWFSGEPAKQRAKAAQVENLPALVAELGIQFVPTAHKRYYLDLLHRERLRRGLLMTAIRAAERIRQEDCQPVEVLQWWQEQTDRLLEFAYRYFPGEFGVEEHA